MKKETYIPEIQAARGVGIILVALGHSEPVRDAYPLLFSWIYSFHMPLFFSCPVSFPPVSPRAVRWRK